MRAGPPEAFDLLREWLCERKLLRCEFVLSEFSGSFRARIVSLTDEQMRLQSDDNFSEMDIGLRSILEFKYGEPDAVEERKDFAGALVAVLARGDNIEPEEFITFVELV
jgi:hypothetical protein